MQRKLVIFLLLFGPQLCRAQDYEKEYVTLFAWEVKQIDEFIERFDDKDSTLIKLYNQKHNPSVPLTREKLIKSLFNAERKDWNYPEIIDFIREVQDKEHPQYLDLDKDDWFASLNCTVAWKGKAEKALLRLVIQKDLIGGYKWVIADVDAKFLNSGGANGATTTDTSQPVLPGAMDADAALNPMSHATDFLNLDMITREPRNIANYIVKSDRYGNDFCLFIKEILDDHLKLLTVNTITYDFLQIKGWDIQIQQFNRPGKNSGWLISKLTKLPS